MAPPLMRRTLLLITLLALFATALTPDYNPLYAALAGVPHPPVIVSATLRDESRTVTLLGSDDPRQIVYEDDLVRIQIGYDQCLAYIERRLRQDQESDAGAAVHLVELKKWVEAEFMYSPQTLRYSRSRFAAAFLEMGIGRVYDKRNQLEVATITIRDLEYICGGTCGWGGRHFYLPDGTLFLEDMDWVM